MLEVCRLAVELAVGVQQLVVEQVVEKEEVHKSVLLVEVVAEVCRLGQRPYTIDYRLKYAATQNLNY